ncbi:arylsulfatase [Psychrobacter lutiphocae]|uniref:arylsulfatase n=1 Tax=Psychrobacter lutiphocae TaxID=540500 RepID=UPI00035E029F|nr:arylsulfatase [Psychrobacter lutiphocae]
MSNNSKYNKSSKDKKPNILVVVVDDMGFSDAPSYGGEAKMPYLTQLCNNGVKFRHSHTSSLCAPTRAMLLTGVDNHLCGLGNMPPFQTTNQFNQPGYEGWLNDRVITIAEVLHANDYHTYMSGKWHLGFRQDKYPSQQGFEKSFAFMGGGTSHWADMRPLSRTEIGTNFYVENDTRLESLPEDFYSSIYFADKMIQYLGEQTDDNPFFAYLAFTAPHDPIQVPDKWIDNYKGLYDVGYDVIKRRRLAKMKDLGLLAPNTPLNPGDNKIPSWDSLSKEQQREQARVMEVYSAMLECMDAQMGRVINKIKDMNKWEDTIVFFMSDNGANPKQPWFYAPNTKEQIERDFDNSYANIGRPNSFVSIGPGWAQVANTPLSYFKLTSYEGGTKTPLIVSGHGVKLRGVDSQNRLHVTDLFPTLLELTNSNRPATANGQPLAPLYGKSYAKILAGSSITLHRGDNEVIGFEIMENKSLTKGDWKVLFQPPPYGDGKHWHLYNIKEDELELNDLASVYPEKVQELVEEWERYAKQVGYIKSNGQLQMDTYDNPEEFYVHLGAN